MGSCHVTGDLILAVLCGNQLQTLTGIIFMYFTKSSRIWTGKILWSGNGFMRWWTGGWIKGLPDFGLMPLSISRNQISFEIIHLTEKMDFVIWEPCWRMHRELEDFCGRWGIKPSGRTRHFPWERCLTPRMANWQILQERMAIFLLFLIFVRQWRESQWMVGMEQESLHQRIINGVVLKVREKWKVLGCIPILLRITMNQEVSAIICHRRPETTKGKSF